MVRTAGVVDRAGDKRRVAQMATLPSIPGECGILRWIANAATSPRIIGNVTMSAAKTCRPRGLQTL